MKSAILVLLTVSAAYRLFVADGRGDALGLPPHDFDRQAARALLREHLRSAMIAAGYEGEDLEPGSDAYRDFASLALEKQRLMPIREALMEKMDVSGGGDEPVDLTCESEFEHFLTPDLEAGYADIIKFEEDGVVVHNYAARVGMPGRSTSRRVLKMNQQQWPTDYFDYNPIGRIMQNTLCLL